MVSFAMNPTSHTTYTQLLRLGSGGMGDVHLALARREPDFQRLVVVKTLRGTDEAARSGSNMLREEARICARLSHPNVVQVTEIVELGDGVMLVMEYLDGQTLSEAYQKAESSFTLPLRLRAICEVLAGLHYAHELKDYSGKSLGIIHRDVSPENVFLTYDGRVKLLDFGVAKANRSDQSTDTGVVKGRLSYMSPEQFQGQPLDRRTDVFSMGCLLFEAITHQRLWKGYSQGAVAAALSNGQIPPINFQQLRIDPQLSAIVGCAMARRREDRYSSAEELRLALEAYLDTHFLSEQASPRDIGDMLGRVCQEERMARRLEISEAIRDIERGRSVAPTPLVPPPRELTSLSMPRAARVPEVDAEPHWPMGNVLGSDPPVSEPTATGLRRKDRKPQQVPQLSAGPQPSEGRPKSAWLYGLIALAVAVGVLFLALRLTTRSDFGPDTQASPDIQDSPEKDGVTVEPAPAALAHGAGVDPALEQPARDPSPDAEAQPPVAEQAPPVTTPQGVKTRPARAYPRRTAAPVAPEAPAAPAPAPPRAPSNSKNCEPPYYFNGGIKTYKPECI